MSQASPCLILPDSNLLFINNPTIKMTSAENGSTGTAKLDFTTFHNVINGKLVCSSQTRHGINPATKQPNAEVPIATLDDVDHAVAAARAAFKSWSKTTIEKRVAALNAFAAALLGYQDEFARLMTIEQGKTVRISKIYPVGQIMILMLL
jgi:delta 1-pyrroline-5-carboxylate dehydrogenase